MDIVGKVAEIVSPVYLVGGSVRDKLLGREPHDYDFATSLLPDEIESRVKAAGLRAFGTGKRYGTIGFRLQDHNVEVTTFRSESYTPGSRKPTVEFVHDITYDLSRRDFTINALAERPNGTIIDPFGGRADLANEVIRTVGKPEERFQEDPLRMLRAARFAAQLNFTVDPETELRTLRRNFHILEVSKERWVQELDRLLTTEHPEVGLDFLARTELLTFILPELAIQVGYDQDSPYHELNLWDHTVKTVSLSPNELSLRWGAFLHDIGKPFVRTVNKHGYSNYAYHEKIGAELVLKIGKYLKWSNERIQHVHDLVLHHLENDSPILPADGAATKR